MTRKFWRRWRVRELPPMQWERVPDETYEAATGYALLAGTQLPPVDIDQEEDES